jgi:hypothetical protein
MTGDEKSPDQEPPAIRPVPDELGVLAWLDRHMFLTLLFVLWLFALLTVVTWKVFFDPVDIPGGTVGAFGILFGALAFAVGLWQFRTKVMDARKGVTYAADVRGFNDSQRHHGGWENSPMGSRSRVTGSRLYPWEQPWQNGLRIEGETEPDRGSGAAGGDGSENTGRRP